MTTRKWGSEFQVNTQTIDIQSQSSVTALNDGGFLVVWSDAHPGLTISNITMQRYDAQGNSSGAEFLASPINTSPGSETDLVQLADGNIWYTTTSDYGSDTDSNGWVISLANLDVRTQALFFENVPGARQSQGVVASLGANGAVGAFFDSAANSGDIKFDVYDATGAVIVDDVIANTNAFGTLADIQNQPSVAANTSGNLFAVAWNDSGLLIGAKVFNNLGVAQSGDIPIGNAGNVAQPSLTWISGDRFVVSWTNTLNTGLDAGTAGIYYAIYRSDGLPLIAPQLANTTTALGQVSSEIVALKNGGFAIAWSDQSGVGGDPSGSAIRLQAFSALGDKESGEILVNTTTGGDQTDVSLATLSDGRIAVTWTDVGSGEVMGQIVDPRDGIVDGSGIADTLYGHDAVGDVITGFDGADTMFGLNGADIIYGGQGSDIGNGGRGDDVAYGGADGDTLNGNQGDDQLFGGKGTDTLTGGKGDDEYNGGAGNDIIFDAEGADVINGGADLDKVDYVFATAGLTASLDGTLTATGAAAGDSYISIESLAGTNFADILRGNASVNTIFGRNGDDRIIGAGGADTLVGNAGNDTFAYANVSESAPAARDQITDFTVVAGDGTTFADRIDLSAIDAIAGGGTANDTFSFIGTGPFNAAGQVRITASGGSDTLVEINTSGTSGAEMAIILKGILPTAVFDEDFVL